MHSNCVYETPCPDLPDHHIPILSSGWHIGVIYGPHGAPDFFSEDYIAKIFASSWKVHHNANRLGVRLIGPTPSWTRTDGGEAGLHPSNIHNCEYAIGTVNFTGDSPVIIAVDGPSLGGLVCPITIVQAELWKMGQVRPGDTIRFVRITHDEARQMRLQQNDVIDSVGLSRMYAYDNENSIGHYVHNWLKPATTRNYEFDAILDSIPATDTTPAIAVRAQGDANVLMEYGENVLDVDLRLCVWVFMKWIAKYISSHPECGLGEISPGVRSVQIQYDTRKTTIIKVLSIIRKCTYTSVDKLVIPCRKIRLPLAFDDHWTHDAIERYMSTVSATAPYVPSNVDFAARINGLESRQQVLDIMLQSTYLVLGLGDVYLNAPCAVAIDPRHRLVTSKYNPTRSYILRKVR